MLGAIWAQSLDRVLGDGTSMPWHVPEDLAHFKQTTLGQPVVMGRRTWQSLPEKVRPLPGRDNTVVSTTPPGDWSAGATVVSSPEQAPREGWVMGGARLYEGVLDLIDVLEVTLMDARLAEVIDTPVFAPDIPADLTLVSDSDWQESATGKWLVEAPGPVRYRFLRYERG